MAKKRKQHEAQAADVVADPVQPAVPAEHDEPAAAALVAGDGGHAAGAAGGEHPGEPPAEAGAADGAAVVDGADSADVETETEAAEGVAPAPAHQSEVSDDASEQDQSPSEISGEQAAPEDAGAGGADTDGQAPGASGDDETRTSSVNVEPERDPGDGQGRGGDFAPVDDDDRGSGASDEGHADVRNGDVVHSIAEGGAPSGSGDLHLAGDGGPGVLGEAPDAGPLNDSDGSADGAAPAPAGPETLDRVTLCGAIGAYQEAFIHGAWLQHAVNGSELVEQQLPDAVFDDMAAFVRQIGERATPDVLAQQLVIKKHRPSPEISEPERIAFTAFAGVLLALDRFVAGEFARKAEETAATETRPAVPSEDTTMELVDAPLATWGGRG